MGLIRMLLLCGKGLVRGDVCSEDFNRLLVVDGRVELVHHRSIVD